MFNRERETRNQACNRKLLTKSFLHNQIEDVINIKNNSIPKEQVDNYDEVSIHAHDIFISRKNKTEVDYINLINIAKKLRRQLQQRLA